MHQSSYDENRDRLVEIMIEKLRHMLSKDHEELDEATYDLQRAFEMFVKELKQVELQMMVEKVNLNVCCMLLENRFILGWW